MHWNLTEEGIPYLVCDSINLISPQPNKKQKELKKVFESFSDWAKNNVEIVGGVPFTLKIKQ